MTDFQLLDDLLSQVNNNEKEGNYQVKSHLQSEEEICPHLNVFEENNMKICEDCGYEMSENTNFEYTKNISDSARCHMRKTDDPGIFKDVVGMGFSEDIISGADKLYSEVTKGKIYRGNSRKGIIFACIFHSYKSIGSPQSYENLAGVFGIDKKVGLGGLKRVNLYAPRDSPIRTTYITTSNLIDELLDKFSVSKDQKGEVQELYIRTKNKSSTLNRSRPQSLAASLVWYWSCKKGKNLSIKDYVKKVDLSELTINKITKELEKILGPL